MVAILVGAALGFLSGLGVGGGSLLLLWLTVVMDRSQDMARAMNLLFFLPCALIATVFRWKQARLPLPVALPAVLGGLLGAALGCLLGPQINAELLKKAFGVLFVITAIRELFYKEKQ